MTRDFTYEEAVAYLSGLLRFGIKFGLDRFAELCRRTGNPERRFRSIHVGGTNGKGSTATFVSSILRAEGYRVGTYLSPYVRDLRERIQINGEMISKDDFARLMSKVAPVLEDVGRTALGEGTEFEAKTLIAFLYFAEQQVDFAAVEVGMGGTYDATNVISPLVAAITNVSLDHTDRLGTTVPQIAADKAGIAKPGAPLVTGASGDAWETIHSVCRQKGVEVWRVAGEDPSGPSADVQITLKRFENSFSLLVHPELVEGRELRDLRIGLIGDFQYENAAVAAAAVLAIERKGIKVSEDAIRRGLAEARLPGRLEVIQHRPTVVLDAAHNPDGAEKLAVSIPRYFNYRRLIMVIGMLRTHSAEGVVSALAPLADEFIATAPGWEKAADAEDIAAIARQHCSNVTLIEPVTAAVSEAISRAEPDDLVLITGSFYTIGEVSLPIINE
jgi:dihydrofolate synthase / folylpolyglutamate synthase